MQQAATFYGGGAWRDAERCCTAVLTAQADHGGALSLLGIIAARSGRLPEAAGLLQRALTATPGDPRAHNNYGNVLRDLGRGAEALASYQRAVQLKPDYPEAWNNRGNALKDLGRLPEALESYRRALALRPAYPEALNNRGVALEALQRAGDALESYQAALRLRPDYAEAHYNHGNALRGLGRLDAAAASYAAALRLRPDYVEAYYNRGNALRDLKRPADALLSYDQALRIRPDFASAHLGRAHALRALQHHEQALASLDRAVSLDPADAEAHITRGNTLHDLGRFDEALQSYQRALQLRPQDPRAHNYRGVALHDLRRHSEALEAYARALTTDAAYADAWNHQGLTLSELGRFGEALASYERALALKADFAEACNNRGITLRELGRLEEAMQSFARALTLDPDFEWLAGLWLYGKAQQCDWEGLDSGIATLVSSMRQGKHATTPFPAVVLVDSPPLQHQVAETWVRATCPALAVLPPLERRPRGARLRLGYYSADFHSHATAFLMAELIERHHRDEFEVIAFSFGPEHDDDMRQRLVSAFDRFIDVRARSDKEIAQLSRQLEVDIAIDLKGFTAHQRAGIFSHRAAPIQVSYLAYPGTMGAPYIDYLIADPTLIPEPAREHYSEKIVYLPHSYQVNDRHRHISGHEFSREELGLPPEGFVFCCFNASYKITPGMFDIWMRLLRAVPGSVLWLLDYNATAVNNLRKEALARGVDAGRLVFARRVPLPEHLARHRAADLFLDTLPCNAHTTASDALWAGLPVLTRLGESFAARVAGSLLNAIGLPELITHHAAEYEATALELARDRQRLARLREKLAARRLTTPLFDTDAYTSNLEEAYRRMFERYQAGLPPEHIHLTARPADSPRRTGAIAPAMVQASGCYDSGEWAQAEQLCRGVLDIQVEHFDALNLLGIIAGRTGRSGEAAEFLRRAVAARPEAAAAHVNYGNVLRERGRLDEALESYDRAIRIAPDHAEAHYNRGTVLNKLQRFEEALQNYRRALEIRPDYAEAHANYGNVLKGLDRYQEAYQSYRHAFAVAPDLEWLRGTWLHAQLQLCDWTTLGSGIADLAEKIAAAQPAAAPFAVIAAADRPPLQRQTAQIWVDATCPASTALPPIGRRSRGTRLRVGYYSADFHAHATAYLIAELIERHDRSEFDVIAFSFGPDRDDDMRRRLVAAFDQFIDVRSRSDAEVAQLSRNLEIDIAVDLKGFTDHQRAGIFAHRAAPIQVSYLGYPGTMGAPYIDYLVADPTLIPESTRQHYSEQIAYLPHSYQVNDRQRPISGREFTREELGLPPEGFVFCCFNASYKITPEVFDIWMRLLRAVPGSVLWLLAPEAAARDNLRREALARGVAAERLVFAARLPLPEHLARHRAADLFLDTLPYNAHTTASDALWAGLPVLTRLGESFAARVSASLLNAIDLPELITHTAAEYEARALELARHPERLGELRAKLAAHRLTTPLFDSALCTRHLEDAYRQMSERYQAGLAPGHLHIAPRSGSCRATAPGSMPQAIAGYRSGDWGKAEALCREMLARQADHFEALHLLGLIALGTGRAPEALELLDRTVAAKPDWADAHNSRGNSLKSLGRLDEALESYQHALRINPGDAAAHYNRGNVLHDLRRLDESLESYAAALRLRPDHCETCTNRGKVLKDLRRFEESLASCDRALALQPDLAAAHFNRAETLRELGRPAEALASYQQALTLRADLPWLCGVWLWVRMQLAEWSDRHSLIASLVAQIERRARVAMPFNVLPLVDSAALHRQAAGIWVDATCPASAALAPIQRHSRGSRIRVGYYSADLYAHATAYLIAELIERHDRNQFEVVALSFGPPTEDEMRKRLAAAFDRFIDVRTRSDQEVAQLSRDLGIDIAVDLKGFTANHRTGIFAHRAAPIQVNYLGYPGTMGAAYIDYLIADATLIPEQARQHYSEKIACLPYSYQVNDRQRRIDPREFTREELGLPPEGFVFCCFNNTYKITPEVFDLWMRLLREVPGSVLWLLAGGPEAQGNLRREALAREVAAERLVFAPRLPLPEHLARYRAADLFLDTLPYNAHTTASDALWAGLPVLTRLGESFVARVSASLLTAIELPELITRTAGEYQAKALELAQHPERLRRLRDRLAVHRLTTPLFDSALFTRHLEDAYRQMVERYRAALAPEHLYVRP
jgi:predicted O-linked N-acetylglucosamine transferase (SPINDLY family)